MEWKIQQGKDINFSQFDIGLRHFLSDQPQNSVDIDKLILLFICKGMGPRKIKQFEKNILFLSIALFWHLWSARSSSVMGMEIFSC